MSQNTLTAERESHLRSLADLLLDARRTGKTIDALPEHLVPSSMEEAYFVQDEMMTAYGEVGGYKVGAASPDAEPLLTSVTTTPLVSLIPSALARSSVMF